LTLHGVLHTFDARHHTHTGAGYWGTTAMGDPGESGCNGGTPKGTKSWQLSQPDDCTDTTPSTPGAIENDWNYYAKNQ